MRAKHFADTDQVIKDPIDYWIDYIQSDLGTMVDTERVKLKVRELRDMDLLKYFTIDNTGIFAYIITDDFLGGKCLSELMFYIRPEHRGRIRLVRKYLKIAEGIASDKNCATIKIGANIGYKDSKFINLLKRFGYVDDTVAKPIIRQ